jgi:hypothetical protein
MLRSVLRYFDQFINANINIFRRIFQKVWKDLVERFLFICSFLKYDFLHSSTRGVNILSFFISVSTVVDPDLHRTALILVTRSGFGFTCAMTRKKRRKGFFFNCMDALFWGLEVSTVAFFLRPLWRLRDKYVYFTALYEKKYDFFNFKILPFFIINPWTRIRIRNETNSNADPQHWCILDTLWCEWMMYKNFAQVCHFLNLIILK